MRKRESGTEGDVKELELASTFWKTKIQNGGCLSNAQGETPKKFQGSPNTFL